MAFKVNLSNDITLQEAPTSINGTFNRKDAAVHNNCLENYVQFEHDGWAVGTGVVSLGEPADKYLTLDTPIIFNGVQYNSGTVRRNGKAYTLILEGPTDTVKQVVFNITDVKEDTTGTEPVIEYAEGRLLYMLWTMPTASVLWRQNKFLVDVPDGYAIEWRQRTLANLDISVIRAGDVVLPKLTAKVIGAVQPLLSLEKSDNNGVDYVGQFTNELTYDLRLHCVSDTTAQLLVSSAEQSAQFAITKLQDTVIQLGSYYLTGKIYFDTLIRLTIDGDVKWSGSCGGQYTYTTTSADITYGFVVSIDDTGHIVDVSALNCTTSAAITNTLDILCRYSRMTSQGTYTYETVHHLSVTADFTPTGFDKMNEDGTLTPCPAESGGYRVDGLTIIYLQGQSFYYPSTDSNRFIINTGDGVSAEAPITTAGYTSCTLHIPRKYVLQFDWDFVDELQYINNEIVYDDLRITATEATYKGVQLDIATFLQSMWPESDCRYSVLLDKENYSISLPTYSDGDTHVALIDVSDSFKVIGLDTVLAASGSVPVSSQSVSYTDIFTPEKIKQLGNLEASKVIVTQVQENPSQSAVNALCTRLDREILTTDGHIQRESTLNNIYALSATHYLLLTNWGGYVAKKTKNTSHVEEEPVFDDDGYVLNPWFGNVYEKLYDFDFSQFDDFDVEHFLVCSSVGSADNAVGLYWTPEDTGLALHFIQFTDTAALLVSTLYVNGFEIEDDRYVGATLSGATATLSCAYTSLSYLTAEAFSFVRYGSRYYIALRVDNHLRQWVLSTDLSTFDKCWIGYGHIGVNGLLTGVPFPEAFVSPIRGLSIDTLRSTRELSRDTPVLRSNSSRLSRYAAGIYGTKDAVWYLHDDTGRICTGIQLTYAGGSECVFTPFANYMRSNCISYHSFAHYSDNKSRFISMTDFIQDPSGVGGIAGSFFGKVIGALSGTRWYAFAFRHAGLAFVNAATNIQSSVYYTAQPNTTGTDLAKNVESQYSTDVKAMNQAFTEAFRNEMFDGPSTANSFYNAQKAFTNVASSGAYFNSGVVEAEEDGLNRWIDGLSGLLGFFAVLRAVGTAVLGAVNSNTGTDTDSNADNKLMTAGSAILSRLAPAAIALSDTKYPLKTRASFAYLLEQFYSTDCTSGDGAGDGFANIQLAHQDYVENMSSTALSGVYLSYVAATHRVIGTLLEALGEILMNQAQATASSSSSIPVIGGAIGTGASAAMNAIAAVALAIGKINIAIGDIIGQHFDSGPYGPIASAYVSPCHTIGTEYIHTYYPTEKTGTTDTQVGMPAPQYDTSERVADRFTYSAPKNVQESYNGIVPAGMSIVRGGIDCEGELLSTTVDSGKPIFGTFNQFDYVLNKQWGLKCTSMGSSILWLSVEDTKILDGKPSNIFITDNSVVIGSRKNLIEVRRFDTKFLRPQLITPRALAFNCTAKNIATSEQLLHGFDGFGFSTDYLIGKSGCNIGSLFYMYAVDNSTTAVRSSNMMPPAQYFGNFSAPARLHLSSRHQQYGGVLENTATGKLVGNKSGATSRNGTHYSIPVTARILSLLPQAFAANAPYNAIAIDGTLTGTSKLRITELSYVPEVVDMFCIGQSVYAITNEFICSVKVGLNGLGFTELMPAVNLRYVTSTESTALLINPFTGNVYTFNGALSGGISVDRFYNVLTGSYNAEMKCGIASCVANTRYYLQEAVSEDNEQTLLRRCLNLLFSDADAGLVIQSTLPAVPVSIGSNYSWYRIQNTLGGFVYQGPNRCVIYRMWYLSCMKNSILANRGNYKRINNEMFIPWREDDKIYKNILTKLGNPNGWYFAPLLLSINASAEDTQAQFTWTITFKLNNAMRAVLGDNYVNVCMKADLYSSGQKVKGTNRASHLRLALDLFEHNGGTGDSFYTYRFTNNNGYGTFETFNLWSDGCVCIAEIQVDAVTVDDRPVGRVVMQHDNIGKEW